MGVPTHFSPSSPPLEGGGSHFTLPESKPRKIGPTLEPPSRGTRGNCSERDRGCQKYVSVNLGWEEESERGRLMILLLM